MNDLISIENVSALKTESMSALNPERDFLLKHIGFDKKIIKAIGHYYFDVEGNCVFH